MQVIINQTQIEKAIMDFMHKRINLQAGTKLIIEMKATRGAEGFSAVVDIVDNEEEHQAEVAQEANRIKAAKEDKLVKAGPALKEAFTPEVRADDAEVLKTEPAAEPVETDADEDEGGQETAKPKSIFSNRIKA